VEVAGWVPVVVDQLAGRGGIGVGGVLERVPAAFGRAREVATDARDYVGPRVVGSVRDCPSSVGRGGVRDRRLGREPRALGARSGGVALGELDRLVPSLPTAVALVQSEPRQPSGGEDRADDQEDRPGAHRE
jgi:hypothetical protein